MPEISKYVKRDQRILAFAGRYRVLISRFTESLFFAGKTSGHIQKRLVEDGTLTLHSRAIPGSLSFCTLSQRTISELGLPKDRATVTPQGLDLAIATLYWAKAGARKRIRLEPNEVKECSGILPPSNVCFSVSGAGDLNPRATLWRVYQTGTGFDKTAETVEKHLESARAIPEWTQLVTDGVLGFLVLADSPSKAKTLSSRFARHRLSKNIRLEVGVGPTASTLHRAFRENWSPDQ